MAGRNPAAVRAGLLLILQIWESLIHGKYMNEACQDNKPPCSTCKSPKPCNNYFCLECKTGGLCPIVFRGDHEHRHHPWLQVRLYTKRYSVLSKDLAHFMSEEGLKHIHTIADKHNGGQRHCNLSSKSVASSLRERLMKGKKRCRGCMASISRSKVSRETFEVCSLECLIEVALERDEWNLLVMKDGAMEPMEPPFTYNEKLLKPPRMLESTPTTTPIDEAPPSPQVATGDSPMPLTQEATAATPIDEAPPSPQVATGDSLMLETHDAATMTPVVEAPPLLQATGDSLLETHEAAIATPVVEAPPLPQATGDSSMLEFHDDLPEEFTLETLAFPFLSVTDDSLMSVTPTEASLAEALSLPPATEDFLVFENPAAPAEPPQPETLPLSEFQGIDYEWVPQWPG